MSLRSRLAILFGLVALVASGLVGAISYRTTTSELSDSTDRFLTVRVNETAQAVRELVQSGGVVTRGNSNRTTRVLDGQLVAADDAIIQVTGRNGVEITTSVDLPSTDASEALRLLRPGRDADPVLVFENIELDGEPYRMVSRALPQGGVVQVARSIAEDERVRTALFGRFVIIATGVALAAAAIGWLIAARTTAPLRRLSTVASDVAETGDFTTDVDDDGRTDEIGKLAASFATMLAALETSRVQQHRLIHDAGHEMRTPLTSLRANVAMLERAPDLPAGERTEILAAIRSELVELGDLFDEMIDLATDQRAAELTLEPIDLAQLASDVGRRWERRSDRRIVVEATIAQVLGDAPMLDRAINNLVSNADKFSPPNEPITIVVRDGSVVVRDRGPGIPVADREHVFDRFYRSEVTRSMPGSGLGLSIVAQIVERHGGQVWATDSDGGGAEVGFRLQVAASSESDGSTPVSVAG